MSINDADYSKRREIRFCPLHPDPDQVQSAVLLLSDVTGIEEVVKVSPHSLQVAYNLRQISLQVIEEALIELGFHLDNGLLAKLKRALYYYTEETQRANRSYQQDINSTQEVFVNRYRQLPHGCRDARPRHWREYL